VLLPEDNTFEPGKRLSTNIKETQRCVYTDPLTHLFFFPLLFGIFSFFFSRYISAGHCRWKNKSVSAIITNKTNLVWVGGGTLELFCLSFDEKKEEAIFAVEECQEREMALKDNILFVSNSREFL
jgi:hypothetical protein